MNKKIVSFVLAMVLSLCPGSSFVFGDPYEKTGDIIDSQWNSTGSTSYTVSIPDKDKAVVGDTESKICTVFNYKAGVLLSVMDAERNVTVYDAGKARATLGYNDDGTFTVTNFYLSGSDWSTIEKMSGSTDAEKLKTFLLSVGIKESNLKASANDDGNVDTDTQADVAWLSRAAEQLQKGINYSIGIDLTTTYGASMTWSVNGKAQETFGYDGTVLAEYNYNAAGFLESITQTTYSLKDGEVVDNSNDVQFEKTTTTVYMDAYGRQSYATDTDKNTVATYSYSANGSIVSSYSKEDEGTTYYSNGKASYVMNDAGMKTTQYDYNENGTLDGVTSYNYDADTSALTGTTATAYQWGRAVGTVDLSSGSFTYSQIRAAISELKSNPTGVLSKLESDAQNSTTSIYSCIKSICLYESDLSNNALLSFLGISSATATKMKTMSNGYSSVGTADFSFGKEGSGSTTSNIYAPNGTTINGTFYEHGDTVTISEGEQGINVTVNVTVNDKGGASYKLEGTKKYVLKEAEDKVIGNIDPAVEGTLFTSENATEAEIKAMAESLGIDVNDAEAMANLKKGFYTDSSTGKMYAVVSAESVNIMDGNGFQGAEGETILIEVDEKTKASIIASGDTNVMFMGDVRTDINGYMTMAMNTNYSGGFASGAEIADLQKAIENEDLSWVKENTATNTAIFNNDGLLVEWQSGWNMLTGKQTVLRERTDAAGNVVALF